MEAQSFILDLAIVLAAVGAAATVCARFKWPKVIAYILVGVVLGPHTFGGSLIANDKSIEVLGQIGVIFLMFTLGLEFSMRKLKRLGKVVFPTAILDMAVMIWLGYMIGRHIMGWGMVESLFLGAAISDSATTLLAKTINEMGWGTRRFTRFIFGVTITEDILCIAVIALLTGLVFTGEMQFMAIAKSMGGLLVFLTGIIAFGLLLVPRTLRWVGRLKDDEALLLVMLGFCFLVSFVAAHLKYSLALGAFMMGVMGAESEPLKRIYNQSVPLRTMFSSIFFVTIGLMVNPNHFITYWHAIVGITAVVIVGKTINNTLGGLLTGIDLRNSVQMGMGLAAIGEFAYLVALIGVTLNAVHPSLYPITVGVSVLSTLLSPAILRFSDPASEWVDRKLPGNWRNYLNTYHHWVERFQHSDAPRHVFHSIRNNLLLLAFYTALVACIYLVTRIFVQIDFSGLSVFIEAHKQAIIWFIATLAVVPFAVMIFFRARSLGDSIADSLLPEAAAHSPWSVAFRGILRLLAILVFELLLFIEVVVLSGSLMPKHPVDIGVIVSIYLLVAVLGWRNFRHHGLKSLHTLRLVLQKETETNPNESTADLLDIHTDSIRLRNYTPRHGRTLRELNLRARTGASVVGIDRGNTTIVNPTPDECLENGDRVILLGSDEQLMTAKQYLLNQHGTSAATSYWVH